MASYIPDTDTLDTLTLTPTTKANIHNPAKPWGRLMSTYCYLQPVDLLKETFSIGRAEECDFVLTSANLPIKRITNISKKQFTIAKEENLIFIEDHSKNGTFLNGLRIGKGNRHILQNDDEIAIGYKELKVYVFNRIGSNNDMYLPEELQKKYQVSRLLGRGACGEVRLVFNKLTCLPFAVKKIIKGKNVSSRANLINHPDKIKEEIKILKALNHPFIIRMEEIVETDDSVFIILEYMEGGELTDLIYTKKKMTETEVKFLFYQAVLAVQYLHRMDITHRDIKPENVLLKCQDVNDTTVKLSDFGLSKILEEDSIMNTICGTPDYVAPEVIDRTVSVYSNKVDVWSLGVLLFFMLSQRLPFRSPDNDKIVLNQNIIRGLFCFDAEAWEGITEDAKELIERMLTVEPENRYSIDDVIAHPWISEDVIVRYRVENRLYTEFQTGTLISEEESECSSVCSPPLKRSRVGDSSSL